MRVLLWLVLSLLGCGARERGIEVEVFAATRPTVLAGMRLARFNVTGVRGLSCLELMARAAPISSAYAHGSAPMAVDPTASGPIDVSLDLMTASTVPLATLRAAPDTWCGLELTVGPSSADAPWKGASMLVQTHDGTNTVTVSTRVVQLVFAPLVLSTQSRHHQLVILVDAAPLAARSGAPDARQLFDSLVSSLTASELAP